MPRLIPSLVNFIIIKVILLKWKISFIIVLFRFHLNWSDLSDMRA